MGWDPDEEQQMTHMLMCSNEFELEGLITVTGRFLRKNPPQEVKTLKPQLFHKLIDGYAEVYPNLLKHGNGWHTPEYLHSIVATGQPGNGMEDVGEGKSSPGSRLVTAALLKDDPRPVHIVVNAGSNTLAQALFDFRESHTEAEVKAFVSKLQVFENSAQDVAGAWILHEFPDIHWIRSVSQTQAYGGPRNLRSAYMEALSQHHCRTGRLGRRKYQDQSWRAGCAFPNAWIRREDCLYGRRRNGSLDGISGQGTWRLVRAVLGRLEWTLYS